PQAQPEGTIDPCLKPLSFWDGDTPVAAQVYASGASGNRAALADRLYRGMAEAWKGTKRHPLGRVRYQLLAQKLRPDTFVVALGYGGGATGYVPTDRAVKENDSNLRDWCGVAQGAEKALTAALRQGLAKL